ncbi:MAG: hypothetical protein K940chlam9_01072 [Chlamydiae bacterium]|nr:hypothetical protein [Chlamydiota bacterium]
MNIEKLNTINENSVWEQQAPKAKRLLLIKRIAITTLAILNLAGIAALLYHLALFLPIPEEALLVSPFIVGVVAALVYLKFPTFGANTMNYAQYTNPATWIGKGFAYLFFGPFLVALDRVDRTAYHDPEKANKISMNLETKPLFTTVTKEDEVKGVGEKYGRHIENLTRFGFIPKDKQEEFLALYKEFKPLQEELKHYQHKYKSHLEEGELPRGDEKWKETFREIEAQREELEEKWITFRDKLKDSLPHPVTPRLDFSKKKTKVKLFIEKYLYFRSPEAD